MTYLANRISEERLSRLVREVLRELLALRASHAECVKALERVRGFVEEEWQCREVSYLPEPSSSEEGYLQDAQDAMETIDAALANARKLME